MESDSLMVFQRVGVVYHKYNALTIPLGLHISGPGDSKERPSCQTEAARRVVRLDKIREIGWHVFFDGAESC